MFALFFFFPIFFAFFSLFNWMFSGNFSRNFPENSQFHLPFSGRLCYDRRYRISEKTENSNKKVTVHVGLRTCCCEHVNSNVRKAVRKYWQHIGNTKGCCLDVHSNLKVIIIRLQQAKGGYENAGKN